jgi:hypothetical protein
MRTPKIKVTAEPVELELAQVADVSAPEVERVPTPEELLILGKDAPLTEMIYGTKQMFNPDAAPELPEATSQIQGEMDPLQRFINLYQPGEMVMKNNFRKHLLQILEDWKNQ